MARAIDYSGLKQVAGSASSYRPLTAAFFIDICCPLEHLAPQSDGP